MLNVLLPLFLNESEKSGVSSFKIELLYGLLNYRLRMIALCNERMNMPGSLFTFFIGTQNEKYFVAICFPYKKMQTSLE